MGRKIENVAIKYICLESEKTNSTWWRNEDSNDGDRSRIGRAGRRAVAELSKLLGFRERPTASRIFRRPRHARPTASRIFPESGIPRINCLAHRKVAIAEELPSNSSTLPGTSRTACPIGLESQNKRRPRPRHLKRTSPSRAVCRKALWSGTRIPDSARSSRPRD